MTIWNGQASWPICHVIQVDIIWGPVKVNTFMQFRVTPATQFRICPNKKCVMLVLLTLLSGPVLLPTNCDKCRGMAEGGAPAPAATHAATTSTRSNSAGSSWRWNLDNHQSARPPTRRLSQASWWLRHGASERPSPCDYRVWCSWYSGPPLPVLLYKTKSKQNKNKTKTKTSWK